MNYRIEKDSIGEIKIADHLNYGIQTARALAAFPSYGERINPQFIRQYLYIKKACAAVNHKLEHLSGEQYNAIVFAINQLISQVDAPDNKSLMEIYSNIVVDPYQGGAGTSLNMNINEVIANIALVKMNRDKGDYSVIHPLDHVNKNQSTNDTYPTAFKAAAIVLLRELQESFSSLQNALQKKEIEFSNVLKLGRTQLEDAVPMTLGQEFGAYGQAISRDRWRFYNVEERLRSVNLGGTAIGNSIAGEIRFTTLVYNELRSLTGLPIAKSEDLIDGTQNLDVIVESFSIIKTAAVSVQKICNDLRLLSSGPNGGFGEINLPKMQAGSTIMPGKVNPVILEHTIQICELVKGHDVIISNLVSAGNLELNQYMPMIAHLYLKSAEMLKGAVTNLAGKCIAGISANPDNCMKHLMNSTAIAALLMKDYGYDRIAEIVKSFSPAHNNFISYAAGELSVTVEKLLETVKNEIGI